MKKLVILCLSCFLFSVNVFSQVYPNKVVGERNAPSVDSLKVQEYPYIFPIWGEKVAKMGYQMPYSAGVGVGYFWQESDLIIDNLQVGFNNGPMYNVDEIIRFNDAVSASHAINIRPDIWLFPFLNIYALFAQAKTSTSIDAALWLPDTANNWSQKTAFSTEANFDATLFGFGMTPTFGIGGYWSALDMNVAWTDVSALDKPVFTFVFGPRIGKTFKFKRADQNMAIWVGGFRVKFTALTEGSLDLSEVISTDELQGKVNQGFERVDEAEGQVNTWWESLTPIEQANPANIAKYNTANRTIEAASNFLTAADGALSTAGSSTVQYSLDKNLKNKWNFIVGSQFQLNRHWMLRAEVGFLGSRQQVLTQVQYRFGL
jgi:hypothetical protein